MEYKARKFQREQKLIRIMNHVNDNLYINKWNFKAETQSKRKCR